MKLKRTTPGVFDFLCSQIKRLGKRKIELEIVFMPDSIYLWICGTDGVLC